MELHKKESQLNSLNNKLDDIGSNEKVAPLWLMLWFLWSLLESIMNIYFILFLMFKLLR